LGAEALLFRLKTRSAVFFVALVCVRALCAYGPVGHEIVGGIADELLSHKPAGAQISVLIDGITLQKAAVIPDEIRGWDKKGVDDPKSFHYRSHPRIDKQLCDFWRANQPTHETNSSMPSHHWFHYTDVPVSPPQKYRDGKVGRRQWDIVHMIPYCVSVLRGETMEENPRKITKPVAVILLAHYVGDIHQPLHVGAEYFDSQGRVTDPDRDKSALPDEGGNTLTLELSDDPPRRRGMHKKKFHGFWDFDAVNTLLPALPATDSKKERREETDAAIKNIVHEMISSEPKNWRLSPSISLKNYAEAWADEILPLAREAHERVTFSRVKPLQDEGRTVAAGEAQEKAALDHILYREWASKVVREELHKAGWRLADLLEQSVRSTTPNVASGFDE
jgi:hypothetical protein